MWTWSGFFWGGVWMIFQCCGGAHIFTNSWLYTTVCLCNRLYLCLFFVSSTGRNSSLMLTILPYVTACVVVTESFYIWTVTSPSAGLRLGNRNTFGAHPLMQKKCGQNNLPSPCSTDRHDLVSHSQGYLLLTSSATVQNEHHQSHKNQSSSVMLIVFCCYFCISVVYCTLLN